MACFLITPGARRLFLAALGASRRTWAISSSVDRPAFFSTCSAVIASIAGQPSRLARLPDATCWRTISGQLASIWIMPSMCPAIARTSHSVQSVRVPHCSGVRRSSMSATRSYSVSARRAAVSRSSRGGRGSFFERCCPVVVVMAVCLPVWW